VANAPYIDLTAQGTGNLGKHVVAALLAAGFGVTVLSRSASRAADIVDSPVRVVEVDFSSRDSLVSALENIDGLVCTLGGGGIETQSTLVDAAVKAGVKRFIPSEFGSVTTCKDLENFPPYADMWKLKAKLRRHAEASELTWTVLAAGAYLDFVLKRDHFIDFTEHKVTLLDDGNNRTSITSMAKVGIAISSIFRHPDATQNRIVRVSEAIVTQNKLLGIARELRPETEWSTSKVPTSMLLQKGLEGLKGGEGGDHSNPAVYNIIIGTAMAGDKYGAAFDQTDNELLGVEPLTDEELREIVAERLSGSVESSQP
jgi:NAD(P)-dependent dehydrogenase (short-subunit alcohol dehydrogenase family)